MSSAAAAPSTVRRYGNALQRLRFLAFAAAAFVVGFLRGLPRRSQAAAKVRGVIAGWREPLPAEFETLFKPAPVAAR